jgi:CheY-like chemotaxis protein
MQQLLTETTRLNDEQKEYLEILRHCGDILLGLVDDLMDLLRIGTGKLSMVPAKASIQECVESVLKVQQCAANGRGIDLLKDIPSRQELPHVMVDHFRLKQVLLNLIGNSLKATPREGQITVHCEVLSHNQMAEEKEEEERIRIRVSVEDTGCGMTEKDLKSIFQPFVQVQNNDDGSSSDDHTSPKATSYKPSYEMKQGVGLGLSICKEVVTSMGGDIQCKSVLGQGTTFWFDVEVPVVRHNKYLTASKTDTINETKLGLKVEHGDSMSVWSKGSNGTVSDSDQPAADTPCRAPVTGTVTQASTPVNTAPTTPYKLPRKPYGEGLRVLLADDNAINIKILSRFFELEAYDVDCACDGKEALDLYLQAETNTYDVIALDLQMPVMTG